MLPKSNKAKEGKGTGGHKSATAPLLSPSSALQEQREAATVPTINQYGSFLHRSSSRVAANPPPAAMFTDSGHPLGSPLVNEYVSLFGGAKVVLPSSTPTSWASNPSAMRDRVCRSKYNADRPAKVAAAASLSRFPQPDFSGESSHDAGVVGSLSASVPRTLRNQAIPVASVPKSVRGVGLTEGLVLDQAIARANPRDITGNSRILAFAVLPSLSDEHLLKVAADCHIDLNVADGSPVETLSLIRATELAQAELAQTRAAIATKQEEDRMFEAREKEARELAAVSAGADLQLVPAFDKRGGP